MPIFLPATIRVTDGANSPCRIEPAAASMLALRTGNDTLLMKFARASSPRSNSWFPIHWKSKHSETLYSSSRYTEKQVQRNFIVVSYIVAPEYWKSKYSEAIYCGFRYTEKASIAKPNIKVPDTLKNQIQRGRISWFTIHWKASTTKPYIVVTDTQKKQVHRNLILQFLVYRKKEVQRDLVSWFAFHCKNKYREALYCGSRYTGKASTMYSETFYCGSWYTKKTPLLNGRKQTKGYGF